MSISLRYSKSNVLDKMSTNLSMILPVLTEPVIWDIQKVKKEPEDESNLPDIKVEQFTQVNVVEEPKSNVYVKQELNEDVDVIDIKNESDNISDYNADFETSNEIENNYELSHLVPKIEPKYDIRNNPDPNFLDVEGNIFKINVFDHDAENVSESENDLKVSDDTEYYSCDLCKGYFVSMDTRDRHIPICAKKKKATITRKKVDYGNTVIKCCICHAIFSNKIKLHNHICGKIRENPYVCEICHRQFSRKSGLKNHSKIHKYIAGRERTNY